MAETASVPPLLGEYTPRLYTVADLAALPEQLPSGPVRYELHHGRLIDMPPPGDVHGAVESKIAAALVYQGEYAGHGKARSGDVGIVLNQSPAHVFGADAVFISNARLPIQRSPEGYLLTIPDLVVEIRSKNDSLAALQRKADDYLQAGVRVVWLIDPLNRVVSERRVGQPERLYTETDTLTLDEVIPGFALSVAAALAE
jgi:Uma2 family endonuclease